MALLEISGLKKSFGGLTAVNDVTFTINNGEIVGLIGPNGSGKTTIFNLVSGFYNPDGGEIKFRGENICGYKPHVICKRGIARTFQIVKPFLQITAHKNVRTGAYNRASNRKIIDQNVEEILDIVDLSSKKNILASNLTIADQKRLELARTLATKPQLLLLDEIMAGLNPVERENMINVIRKINVNGITILIIEHHVHVIMSLSNRVMVLDYGKKIAEGSPEQVSKNENVIKAYLGDQSVVKY